MKNTIFICLTLIFFNSLSAQNIENDPFQELEPPVRKNDPVEKLSD